MDNHSQTTLLILAAGASSRFGRLKQLEPIGPNEETLLEFNIYDALNAGVSKVVLVIRKEIETEMKSYFSSDRFPKLDISFVIQSTNKNRNKPLGTAHAILSAQASVKGNFIVINADDYYGKEAFTLINEYYIYNNKPTTYSMVPYVLNETLSENGSVNRGICKIGENRILQEIEERINLKNDEIGPFWLNDYQVKQREDKEALVSMNLWALNESIFPKLEKKFAEFISNFHDDHTKEFQFPTVINQLINDGEIIVKVLDKGKDWMGITFSEDKEFVQANIKAKADLGEYPNPLF